MAKKYYRSEIARLKVQVDQPDTENGEVAPKYVQFDGYQERWDGDKVNVGYLETDNEMAQLILEEDHNVMEIDKDAFNKATGKDAKRALV